jgi:hypothetical protein
MPARNRQLIAVTQAEQVMPFKRPPVGFAGRWDVTLQEIQDTLNISVVQGIAGEVHMGGVQVAPRAQLLLFR